MNKFFLFTQVHSDYEGSFGDLEELATEEEALEAIAEFEKDMARSRDGWNWTLISGEARSTGEKP